MINPLENLDRSRTRLFEFNIREAYFNPNEKRTGEVLSLTHTPVSKETWMIELKLNSIVTGILKNA